MLFLMLVSFILAFKNNSTTTYIFYSVLFTMYFGYIYIMFNDIQIDIEKRMQMIKSF